MSYPSSGREPLDYSSNLTGDEIDDRRDYLRDERSELEEKIEELKTELADAEPDDVADAQERLTEAETALQEWDGEYGEELESLIALEGEIGRDTHLIHCDNWDDYAEQCLSDQIPSDVIKWVGMYIDYEKWGRDLLMDYGEYSICGQTYYGRY